MINKSPFKKVLFNPTWQESVEREPLLKYSFYLSGRNNVLMSISDEITNSLDKGFRKDSVNADLIGYASTLMWLWTLGSYEIVRTMCQTKKCFSVKFYNKIDELKKELAKIRIPNAKMEVKGKALPVNSNRSPDGWDIKNKDLLVGDPNNYVSARNIIRRYVEVISSLKPADILMKHEDSYK